MSGIRTFEGFNFFQPPPETEPEDMGLVRSSYAGNEKYLAEHPDRPAAMPITASFICAHAPDYVGLPTVGWDCAQWVLLFERMKRDGIGAVIFQAALWNELRECYYRSKIFRDDFRQWEVISPMLEAARQCGMTVFLGGYGSLSGFNAGNMSDREVSREIDRQTACMLELLERDPGFAGIYYVSETYFQGREPEAEKRLNRIYRNYLGRLAQAAPGKKFLISPATMYVPDSSRDFVEFWKVILDGLPPMILAPQDSVGTGCDLLPHAEEMWRLWKNVADHFGFPLWANIELFERVKFSGPDLFHAASPARVRAQINCAAPFVERCICWEYPFFTGRAVGAEALKHEIFGRKSEQNGKK
ncbi:MAG: DUF4434 domain-containing protein [Lentisphaeria bacterium]|nr:DUF4434 domain-containing protein [Lentisphaeria bacterium]